LVYIQSKQKSWRSFKEFILEKGISSLHKNLKAMKNNSKRVENNLAIIKKFNLSKDPKLELNQLQIWTHLENAEKEFSKIFLVNVIISVTSETSEKGKQDETTETEGAEEPLVLPNNLEKILNNLSQEQRQFYDELPKKSKPQFLVTILEEKKKASEAVSEAVSVVKKKGVCILC
ncbi:9855_t:CDS:2, partial [Diversispora eburnea]